MTALAEAKTALRVQMRARRRALEAGAWDVLSLAVCGRVAAIEAVARARTLLGYWPMAGEPDLRGLMKTSPDAGLRWCVPAWRAEAQSYAPAEHFPDLPAVRGPQGAPQPARLCWVDPAAVEVVCLPGLAFDAEGHRIGHGRGYYDRLLTEIDAARRAEGRTAALKLGVTLEALLVAEVPVGETDVGMDGIITETRTIAVSGRV